MNTKVTAYRVAQTPAVLAIATVGCEVEGEDLSAREHSYLNCCFKTFKQIISKRFTK